mgnify:CR=1 FL=1
MSIYNPFSLDGKTILVTGASSGIGKATAIECSRLGAKVYITGRNEFRLKETFSSLIGEGHEWIVADIKESIDTIVNIVPELDGCVSNAGITKTLLTQFINEESLNEVLHVNTISPILLIQKLLKKKKLKKESSIVFTSSISGVTCAVLGNAMYSASKGAINGFVKNAALDLASKKIRVNAVCPGMIDTGILDAGVITAEQLEREKERYPLKRFGKPEEVAYAIIYLLSDASAFVTGTNLFIDGGITLQ